MHVLFQLGQDNLTNAVMWKIWLGPRRPKGITPKGCYRARCSQGSFLTGMKTWKFLNGIRENFPKFFLTSENVIVQDLF